MIRNGGWKQTFTGAALVAALALAWNVYHGTTTEHGQKHQRDAAEIRTEAERWAKVLAHLEQTEPAMREFQEVKIKVARHDDAVLAIQTALIEIKADLRDIRDALYGRRPREPQR